jgi:hypothetical protein
MKRFAFSLVAPCMLIAACSGSPERRSTLRFAVSIVEPADLGSDLARRDIAKSEDKAESFKVRIEAQKVDGTRDTSFDGYVRLSAKPGTVLSATGQGASGRSIKMQAGLAEDITVPLYNAFGDTRIIAEDIGYVPAPAGRTPTCADGLDNDGDGRIDFPSDEGCAFANDDSEVGGTFAAGASQTVYYKLPRAFDVRGATCSGAPPVCDGGAATPFKSQQIQVDTGFRTSTREFAFNTVVTRVASNGFYVQDLENDIPDEDPCASPPRVRTRRGYGGLFSFNFNPPQGMRVCDRMRTLGGTATEFFGSIQLGFPTWTLEEWVPKKPGVPDEMQDARARDCGVPEPKRMLAADIATQSTLLANVHSLVKVESGVFEVPVLDAMGNRVCDTATRKPKTATHTLEARISNHFGSGLVPTNPNYDPAVFGSQRYLPNENASNCDLNGNGSIDFEVLAESSCSDSCTADVECTEWSNFFSRSTFFVVLKDSYKDATNKDVTEQKKVQADGSTSTGFSPFALRGKVIRLMAGTLGYFSGGNQFTIEARCADDVVTDPNQMPKNAADACVFPRSEQQLEDTQ